jgi:hypothetical protein
MSPKKSGRELRRLRLQRIIFSAIAIIVILSWIVSLISK